MSLKIPLNTPRRSCCPGAPGESTDSCGTTSGCECAPEPKRGRWIKPLISGIVLLAALLVGLASLRANRRDGQAGSAACCPAPVTIAPVGQQEYGFGGSTVDDSTQAPAATADDADRGKP